jgi:hypothetical protein
MTEKAPKQYKTPAAFERALNFRIKDERRKFVFFMQRFVARVCFHIESAVLKGGLGLEFRLNIPRTTEDADLIISGSQGLAKRLGEAGALDLGDFLRYDIQPDRTPTINAPGLKYPGERYLVRAFFATGPGPGPWPGNPRRKFKVEISIRSPAGFDLFESRLEEFPQVPAASIRIYSLPWQISEKVHAYNDPRHRDATNPKLMRPRDLLDICRIARSNQASIVVEASSLRSSLSQTFERRKALEESLPELPTQFPPMPAAWETSFQKELQASPDLPWKTPADAYELASRFLDPVLSGVASGVWDPTKQVWEPSQEKAEPSLSPLVPDNPDLGE